MSESRSLGICLGASTIKAVELIADGDRFRIGEVRRRGHESNPRKVFGELLEELGAGSYDHIALTGRKFRSMVAVESITEPEAVEYALEFSRLRGDIQGEYTALASLGAENFVVYALDRQGHIETVHTGNKCASGTGEFFLQQVRRMDIGPEKAVELAQGSQRYRVSGRCSVFCKSDCTHALNKGVPVGRVSAGLCEMLAEKVMDLLERLPDRRVIAVGGVTANAVVMDSLRDKVDSLCIPPHAGEFEALGAAWFARSRRSRINLDTSRLFRTERSSFSYLPPIRSGRSMVAFKELTRAAVGEGDECILGLDVGSTTTKAVLLRVSDNALCGSVYLRTNGDPVQASRNCYRALAEQAATEPAITGLAVTGSGRRIAGLHAKTDAIINEIIAHATGAAHYDPRVDTIFEIGGQDAKYTYLTNGVPSDYAMNEACSAGTGSFLEESARESLGIDYREIERIAVRGESPPNFNDQCAAFISSDIKTATHEGIGREDITAGLVYSICMNYVNRVKGQRKVGSRIFMQGGVCYNSAVPLAMANLIGRPIVVPPEPGLTGAFGVALELKNRIRDGLARKRSFRLTELAERGIEHGKSFVCKGGKEKCDRGCEINMLIIDGKKYPFGGACDKYYNLVYHISRDRGELDLVRARQEMVFGGRGEGAVPAGAPRIGISRSYLTNTFYPLYHEFFTRLDCEVVLSDGVDAAGLKRTRSSFCYPGEIAHGCYHNLLSKKLDFIFLPRILELEVEGGREPKKEHQCTCVLLQSEAYWLKSAFGDMRTSAAVLSPVLNFSRGFAAETESFRKLARRVGRSAREGADAYRGAIETQREITRRVKELGRRMIARIEEEPKRSAVVLFGRPYNAFAGEANLGIPTKLASRGIMALPWDALSLEKEYAHEQMSWAMGQSLWKAAELVKRHPQLFGVFITNFSCGPDSFLVPYFREIMGSKPSLTLELDSHTADAGVNTRIEAFWDIVKRYRELGTPEEPKEPFIPARVDITGKGPVFVSSKGDRVSLYDKRVHVLFPSMGRLGSEAIAAALRGAGVRASALPEYDFDTLKLGRANSSGKECLPLQLTLGGLIRYLEERDPREYTAYFMPTTGGNCRFTQYSVFMSRYIERKQVPNVALLSLTTENGYAGFPVTEMLKALKMIIVSDVMEDIRCALIALAEDVGEGMKVFERQWREILSVVESGRGSGALYGRLEQAASRLAEIPLRRRLDEAMKVAMVGEIFVRRDGYCGRDLPERLAQRGIVLKRAHFFEWLTYVDHLVRGGIYDSEFGLKAWAEFWARQALQDRYEKKVKRILARSGLYEYETVDMKRTLAYGKEFFDLRFTGESIVVTGSFFKDILHSVHGVISIGPFACMPTRVIESVLSVESTMERKRMLDANLGNGHQAIPDRGIVNLPFLSIESDGNPFPQIVEARVEAFCLQVQRLREKVEARV